MKRLIIGILPLTVWGIAPPVEAEVAAKLLGQADVLAQGEVLPVKAEVATEFPIQADVLAQGEVPAQISNVILNSTERELEIIFETLEGDSLLIDANRFRTEGKQLIAEIPNGVLSLSTGQAFSVDNPTADIAQVQVTQLQGETVQVVVTGQDGLPTRDVVLRSGILAYVLNPGENEIAQELVITGEQDSPYVEPIASTATRTDTPLRDVPQSIQVIPQEVLEDQQVVRLNEALRNASGVVAGSNDPRGQRFNIRGFDSSAVLRDGFRLTNGGTGNIGFPELANIEQIEVLKGPAAILFGALEPGGVVNLVSKKPLSEPVYDVGFRLGNRGFVEPSVDISGPLDPHGRVRYRLNALYRSEDYFRGDFTTDTERFFVAPTITAKLSDRTDLTINLEYRDDERANDFGLIAIGDQVADIPFDRALNDPDLTSTSDFLRTGYQLEHRFSDAWKIRNSFHFTDYDTSVIVGLGSRVFEDTGIIVSAPGRLDQPTDSFELQTNVVGKFSTGFVDHTLLTGVDLYRREDDGTELRADLTTRNILNIFNPDFDSLVTPNFDELPLFLSSEGKTDNIGVYLQDQVTLLDNLKLLVGFRYDSVYQDGVSITRGRETITDRHDDAFSPRVGIVYQPIEPISLFTSYSRSFAPNFGTTVAGDILEPERGTQFEFGVKAELLEGDLSVNLAYFDLTKQNVSTADPNNIGFAIATGEQRSRGLELDVIGELLPGWNMIGNYAYTSTEITEDNSGLEGNELFGVPEHNFNLWSTYTIQRGAFNGLGFGFGLNYVAERFGDNANSFSLDPYVLTNAALFYRRDNWQTSLNFRNLFDVDYIESAENRRTSEINPGEGFTVIGSMSIQF